MTVFSSAAFKIVKSWLGPEAVSLLKFTSKNEVQDYVSAEYLPPHMGGTVSIGPDTRFQNKTVPRHIRLNSFLKEKGKALS